MAVSNYSSVTSAFSRMLLMARFALLIMNSKTPPKWGASGGQTSTVLGAVCCIGRCLLLFARCLLLFAVCWFLMMRS